MDLKQFLNTYPQIAEFDESNSIQHQQIQKLISKPMKLLGSSLVYQRSPYFNDLLKAQGTSFKTIVSCRGGTLTGLFSISTSPRTHNGKEVNVAYLGDFRIENDLKIAAFWRKHYGQTLTIFSKSDDLERPKLFITAILKENKLAHRSLVQNSRKRNEFKYHLLRSVNMVNILSKPLILKPKPLYKVRYVLKSEEERLIFFMDYTEREKLLGFDFVSKEQALWKQRKKYFPNFDVARFLVVETPEGEWVAVTLPSSPDSIKRMVLKEMNRPTRLFFSILKFFGLDLPTQGEFIKTLYLTHFNCKNSANPKKAIDSIIHFLQTNRISSTYHMISFADWWNQSWREYLTYSTEVNLFEVTSGDDSPQTSPNGAKVLGFEMAMV